jgi:predicted alpha/beta-fold hydrolase
MSHGTDPSVYRAPRWLPGGQLQTIYAYYLRSSAAVRYRRERWETPDEDFIDLDWLDESGDGSRLLVLFHGLEGCSRSHYALSLMHEVGRQGFHGVIPHFRGCSGETNRLKRAYHAGDSNEIDWILRRIKERRAIGRIYAVGISLGANMLLKWLGEQRERALDIVDSAVAVSTPVDLRVAARQLDSGWNKLIYTSHFLRTMKRKVLAKIDACGLQLDAAAIRRASTFRELDDVYTAPLHGFKNAQDYWQRASSKPWLKYIRVPTLLINARNDPFFREDLLPAPETISSSVTLDYPESGGHVGFVTGRFPGHLRWLPQRILSFVMADEQNGDGQVG